MWWIGKRHVPGLGQITNHSFHAKRKQTFAVISIQQGFLVESKLLKLLAPLEKDDQSLMKLDAIFAALHVENEDDIYRLATYFNEQSTTTADDTRSGASSEIPPMAEEKEYETTDINVRNCRKNCQTHSDLIFAQCRLMCCSSVPL